MLSFLYVYSDHSILECYNLFSGVELSMRSFFVILVEIRSENQIWLTKLRLRTQIGIIKFGIYPKNKERERFKIEGIL